MNDNMPETGPHQLKCLEVWGGSRSADHSASVPGLDISVNSRPVEGSESGGDLYLISSCSSGWISRILLADVSGHGDNVSHLSSLLRKAMHKSINTVDQTKIARSLNVAFNEISGGTKFATALLITYYAPSGHLIFVNAGHPPPMICRANSNKWTLIDQEMPEIIKHTSKEVRVGIKNLPLGVIDSTQFEQVALKVNEGDRICAYTDAFIEAQKDTGELLGINGLADLLSSISTSSPSLAESEFPLEVKQRILADGYELAEDDHTLLSFTHNGQATPKAGMSTVSNYIKNGLGLGHSDTVL
ncbi:MAG: PP2C family protein-serine/threonine phosphatase [Phycisphaerales bacterium]|jgi:sigma-B regulation protein RsbU (phosphoserine phosphatase)|nr:PP2C family protein-serine/threonine phosphatase [Phycisphaerales bacterium]